MALVNVNDIVRVACRQTYDTGGQDVINVIHMECRVQTAVTDDDVRDNVGEVIEIIFDPIRLLASNTLKYTVLEMKNITQDILMGTIPWPTFVQGAVAAPIVSPQVVALSIMKTFKSRVAGRRNWSGVPENVVTDGILNAAWLTAMGVAQTNLLTDLIGALSVYAYIVFNREFETFNVPNGSLSLTPTRTQRRRSTGFGT